MRAALGLISRAVRAVEAQAQPIVDVMAPGPLVRVRRWRVCTCVRPTLTCLDLTTSPLVLTRKTRWMQAAQLKWDAAARRRAAEAVQRALTKGVSMAEASGGGRGGIRVDQGGPAVSRCDPTL